MSKKTHHSEHQPYHRTSDEIRMRNECVLDSPHPVRCEGSKSRSEREGTSSHSHKQLKLGHWSGALHTNKSERM